MWADWRAPSACPIDVEPLFPIPSFEPGSECPHKGNIGDEFVCMCRHCMSPHNEHVVRTAPADKIEEPADKIARWRRQIEEPDLLTAREKELLNERIDDLTELLDLGPKPTKYVPTPGLRGGIG